MCIYVMKGKEFRKWRRDREISQQKVADYVGCNKSTICRFEQEKFNLLPELQDKITEFIIKEMK